jgi:predicted glycogen debranching enzyme
MIEIGPEICGDLQQALSREWLETNGIGGYASSSLCGAGTRRYHGLLIAAAKPPLGRIVMLSRFEERLTIGEKAYELSCNLYPNATVHPAGFRYLALFRLDPFPRWTYDLDGVKVERAIFMVHGENTTVVRWKLLDGSNPTGSLGLELRPLVAFRDHHHLRHADESFSPAVSTGEGFVRIAEAEHSLFLSGTRAEISPGGGWYRNFEYPIERERGFDFREDLYQPCLLRIPFDGEAWVVASDKICSAAHAPEFEQSEIRRRAELVAHAELQSEKYWPLVLAADQFIVDRGEGKSVIAGYHWFSDWGRDTMIALPGLTLATRRFDVARDILLEFSKHISQGMIPNRFPDEGDEPQYNTVDATLWYFEAIRQYVEATGDFELVSGHLYSKLANIIDWHFAGTRYGIKVDESDWLLSAGDAEHQLTWMDAKAGDWVVTPRNGKPVEIQALWYNALMTLADFAERVGSVSAAVEYRQLAKAAAASFNEKFWNSEENCLYDVLAEDGPDASVRPNQIFAVSLHHSVLDAERSRRVLETVESNLLTPYGLRSLSPRDSCYVGIYAGSPLERDGAYHQGTVWSWLIGPFTDAYRRVHAGDPDLENRVAAFTEPLFQHLQGTMIGQISEIFDADEPHRPKGAAAQAWSVAELLRVTRA